VVEQREVMTLSMQWRIHAMGRFYDAHEDSIVYFDSHSGDTHLLSNFAAHVMQQLGHERLTTQELVNKIASTMVSGDIRELTEAVSGVLEELLSLDILKRE
jgi:PqqD family protein of HPr-rel-A system